VLRPWGAPWEDQAAAALRRGRCTARRHEIIRPRGFNSALAGNRARVAYTGAVNDLGLAQTRVRAGGAWNAAAALTATANSMPTPRISWIY